MPNQPSEYIIYPSSLKRLVRRAHRLVHRGPIHVAEHIDDRMQLNLHTDHLREVLHHVHVIGLGPGFMDVVDK